MLAQAYNKRDFVDEMFVAVSSGWKNHEHFGCFVAKTLGFGVYFVSELPLPG